MTFTLRRPGAKPILSFVAAWPLLIGEATRDTTWTKAELDAAGNFQILEDEVHRNSNSSLISTEACAEQAAAQRLRYAQSVYDDIMSFQKELSQRLDARSGFDPKAARLSMAENMSSFFGKDYDTKPLQLATTANGFQLQKLKYTGKNNWEFSGMITEEFPKMFNPPQRLSIPYTKVPAKGSPTVELGKGGKRQEITLDMYAGLGVEGHRGLKAIFTAESEPHPELGPLECPSAAPAVQIGLPVQYMACQALKSCTELTISTDLSVDTSKRSLCEKSLQNVEARYLPDDFRFDCTVPFFRGGGEKSHTLFQRIELPYMTLVRGLLVFDMHPFDMLEAYMKGKSEGQLPSQFCVQTHHKSDNDFHPCMSNSNIIVKKLDKWKTADVTFGSPTKSAWEVTFKDPPLTKAVTFGLSDAMKGGSKSALFAASTDDAVKQLGQHVSKLKDIRSFTTVASEKPEELLQKLSTKMTFRFYRDEEADEMSTMRCKVDVVPQSQPDKMKTLSYGLYPTIEGMQPMLTTANFHVLESVMGLAQGAHKNFTKTHKGYYSTTKTVMEEELLWQVGLISKAQKAAGAADKDSKALPEEDLLGALVDCVHEDIDQDGKLVDVETAYVTPYIEGDQYQGKLANLERLDNFGFRTEVLVCDSVRIEGEVPTPFGCAAAELDPNPSDERAAFDQRVGHRCKVTNNQEVMFIEAGGNAETGGAALEKFEWGPDPDSCGDIALYYSFVGTEKLSKTKLCVGRPEKGPGLAVWPGGYIQKTRVRPWKVVIRGKGWAISITSGDTPDMDMFGGAGALTSIETQVSKTCKVTLKPYAPDGTKKTYKGDASFDVKNTNKGLTLVKDIKDFKEKLLSLGKAIYKDEKFGAAFTSLAYAFSLPYLIDQPSKPAVGHNNEAYPELWKPEVQYKLMYKAKEGVWLDLPSCQQASTMRNLELAISPTSAVDDDLTQDVATDWVECIPHSKAWTDLSDENVDPWHGRLTKMMDGSHGCTTASPTWHSKGAILEEAQLGIDTKLSEHAWVHSTEECIFSPRHKVVADPNEPNMGAFLPSSQHLETIMGKIKDELKDLFETSMSSLESQLRTHMTDEQAAFNTLLKSRDMQLKVELLHRTNGTDGIFDKVWTTSDSASEAHEAAKKKTDELWEKLLKETAESPKAKKLFDTTPQKLKELIKARLNKVKEELRTLHKKHQEMAREAQKALLIWEAGHETVKSKEAICFRGKDKKDLAYETCMCPMPFGQESLNPSIFLPALKRMRIWVKGAAGQNPPQKHDTVKVSGEWEDLASLESDHKGSRSRKTKSKGSLIKMGTTKAGFFFNKVDAKNRWVPFRVSRPFTTSKNLGGWDAHAAATVSVYTGTAKIPENELAEKLWKKGPSTTRGQSRVVALRNSKSKNACTMVVYTPPCYLGLDCNIPADKLEQKMIYDWLDKSDKTKTSLMEDSSFTERFDEDGDGRLSREEFSSMMESPGLTNEDKEKMKEHLLVFNPKFLMIEDVIDLSTLGDIRSIETTMVGAGSSSLYSDIMGKAIVMKFTSKEGGRVSEEKTMVIYPNGWTFMGSHPKGTLGTDVMSIAYGTPFATAHGLLRDSADQVDQFYVALKQRITSCRIQKMGVFTKFTEQTVRGFSSPLGPKKTTTVVSVSHLATTVYKPLVNMPTTHLFGDPTSSANPKAWWDFVQNDDTYTPHPDSGVDHCTLCDGKDLFNFKVNTSRKLGTCSASKAPIAYTWRDEDLKAPLPRFLKWTTNDRMAYMKCCSDGKTPGINDPRGLFDVTDSKAMNVVTTMLASDTIKFKFPKQVQRLHSGAGAILKIAKRILKVVFDVAVLVWNALKSLMTAVWSHTAAKLFGLLKSDSSAKDNIKEQAVDPLKKSWKTLTQGIFCTGEPEENSWLEGCEEYDNGQVKISEVGHTPFLERWHMMPNRMLTAVYPFSKKLAQRHAPAMLVKRKASSQTSLFDYDPDLVEHCFAMEFALLEQDNPYRFLDLMPDTQLLFCSNSLGKDDPRSKKYAAAKPYFESKDIALQLRMLASHASGLIPAGWNIIPKERGKCFSPSLNAQATNMCIKGDKCTENPLDPCEEGSMCDCGSPNPMLFWTMWSILQYGQGGGGVTSWLSQMGAAFPGTYIQASWSTDYLFSVWMSAAVGGKQKCGCELLKCEENTNGECALVPNERHLNSAGQVESENPLWFLPPRDTMCVPAKTSDSLGKVAGGKANGCKMARCETKDAYVGYDPKVKGWKNCLTDEQESKLQLQSDPGMQQTMLTELGEKSSKDLRDVLVKAAASDAKLKPHADKLKKMITENKVEDLWAIWLRTQWPCHFDRSDACHNAASRHGGKKPTAVEESVLLPLKQVFVRPVSQGLTLFLSILDNIINLGFDTLSGFGAAITSGLGDSGIEKTNDLIVSWYLSEGANVQCFSQEYSGKVVSLPHRVSTKAFMDQYCFEFAGKSKLAKAACWAGKLSQYASNALKFLAKFFGKALQMFADKWNSWTGKDLIKALEDMPILAPPVGKPTASASNVVEGAGITEANADIEESEETVEEMHAPDVSSFKKELNSEKTLYGERARGKTFGLIMGKPNLAAQIFEALKWHEEMTMYKPYELGNAETARLLALRTRIGSYESSPYARPADAFLNELVDHVKEVVAEVEEEEEEVEEAEEMEEEQ
eukprot:CAMPEP_0206545954 /NCGR_PEP_ID=MMETSP0325_2-20121206/12429_1 /ASSEMBLY_ACC=CAM_ASM_000347 /TAXON_ID=2866 /ORGANISM="Crypthecodinium cohnii, Strain Seligo" /LENGTH=2648 /DNA_ID=CAMNT_0054045009 /DNA_START=2 /DNA_END=7948 /DNA_ORIENTATION=+